MKYLCLMAVVLSFHLNAQKDTLRLPEQVPDVQLDFHQRNIPVIQNSPEFREEMRKRDSAAAAKQAQLKLPILFARGIENADFEYLEQTGAFYLKQGKGMVGIYIKASKCVGGAEEYQIAFEWDGSTNIKYNASELTNLDITIRKVGPTGMTDIETPMLVESVLIRPDSESRARIIISGPLVSRVSCINTLETWLHLDDERIQLSKELVNSDYYPPRWSLLNELFLGHFRGVIELELNKNRVGFLGQGFHTLDNYIVLEAGDTVLNYVTGNQGKFYQKSKDFELSVSGFATANPKKQKVEVINSYGILLASGKMLGIEKTGKWKYYYDNEAHQLMARGKYKQFHHQQNFTDQIGYWKYYYENGELLARGKYVDDEIVDIDHTSMKEGTWKYYNREGEPVQKREIVSPYVPNEVVFDLPDYFYGLELLYNWGSFGQ